MKELRVGFDVSGLDPHFKEHAQRGIGRYVRELKRYFDGAGSFDDHESRIAVGYFSHQDIHATKIIERCIARAPFGRQTLKQQIVYPLALHKSQRAGFDVLHFPAHMDAPSWSPMPFMITVLDLIPIVCRDLYQQTAGDWRFRLARALEIRAIKNAARVLVISEHTGNDVHRLLGVPWERISVTPLGVSSDFFVERDPGALDTLRHQLALDRSRPTILYVGGIDQRKNIGYMLQALSRLRARCLEAKAPLPQLLIAGRIQGDKQYPKMRSDIEELDLQGLVVEIGFVADDLLPTLYEMADVLFFPSLYEGFGLTPLEALAVGTRVISSNTSAMPEVLGSCAEYIDPTVVDEAVAALWKVLFEVEDSQGERQRRIAHARSFTWDRTGELTRDAYREYSKTQRLGESLRRSAP